MTAAALDEGQRCLWSVGYPRFRADLRLIYTGPRLGPLRSSPLTFRAGKTQQKKKEKQKLGLTCFLMCCTFKWFLGSVKEVVFWCVRINWLLYNFDIKNVQWNTLYNGEKKFENKNIFVPTILHSFFYYLTLS